MTRKYETVLDIIEERDRLRSQVATLQAQLREMEEILGRMVDAYMKAGGGRCLFLAPPKVDQGESLVTVSPTHKGEGP